MAKSASKSAKKSVKKSEKPAAKRGGAEPDLFGGKAAKSAAPKGKKGEYGAAQIEVLEGL
jgi:hypothetical protein